MNLTTAPSVAPLVESPNKQTNHDTTLTQLQTVAPTVGLQSLHLTQQSWPTSHHHLSKIGINNSPVAIPISGSGPVKATDAVGCSREEWTLFYVTDGERRNLPTGGDVAQHTSSSSNLRGEASGLTLDLDSTSATNESPTVTSICRPKLENYPRSFIESSLSKRELTSGVMQSSNSVTDTSVTLNRFSMTSEGCSKMQEECKSSSDIHEQNLKETDNSNIPLSLDAVTGAWMRQSRATDHQDTRPSTSATGVSITPTIPPNLLSTLPVPKAIFSKFQSGPDPRPFSCQTCQKSFTLKCNLQQHEMYAHSDERPYACTKCDKSFKLKGHLKEHVRSVHTEDRPFSCPQCQKSFKLKSHLKGHMTIHDGLKPYQCTICLQAFRQKQHLARHALTHSGRRLLSCPACPFTFNLSSDLARHARTHSGERPFRCSHCGKAFARKQAVKIHERTHFKPFTCQRCRRRFGDMQALADHEKMHAALLLQECVEYGQSFEAFAELKEHMKSHTGIHIKEKKKQLMNCLARKPVRQPSGRMTRQRVAAVAKEKSKLKASKLSKSNGPVPEPSAGKRFLCSVCERPFKRHCFVLRHEVKCHGLAHAPFLCRDCGAVFTGKTALSRHSQQHKQPAGETLQRCPECSEEFQSSALFQKHRYTVHGVKPFSCEICSKAFASKRSYAQHSSTCKQMDLFKCGKCEASLQSHASLQRHRARVHDLRPYACPSCGSAFTEKGALTRHAATHVEGRPHACQSCIQTFKTRRQLAQHEAVHRGERPYQCFQCGLAFHRRANLERHQASHTGEKRFRCPHCPLGFFMGHDLKRHVRVHTGEKPFLCKICKKAFRRKAAVSLHERRVHRKRFQCSFCSRKFLTEAQLDSHTAGHLGNQPPAEAADAVKRQDVTKTADKPALKARVAIPYSGPVSSLDPNPVQTPVSEPALISTPAPSSFLTFNAPLMTQASMPTQTHVVETAPHTASASTDPVPNSELNPDPGLAGAETAFSHLVDSDNELQTCPESDHKMSSLQMASHAEVKDSKASGVQRNEVNFFLCNFCGSLFPNATMLARHTQALHKPSLSIKDPVRTSPEGPCSRGKMGRKATTREGVSGTGAAMCTECGEEFTDSGASNHMCIDLSVVDGSIHPEAEESVSVTTPPVWDASKSAGEWDESLFYCGHCDKGFKKVSSRNVHQRIHTGEKPFVCKVCSKAFAVKSNLKQHVTARHTDARPYVCCICKAKFKQRSHLKSHEDIHQGIKKFGCSICGQAFRQRSHLQRHRLIHEGIKLHKCEQCSSSFNLRSDLQRHVLIHTGEKPFSCEQCPKRFRRMFQLKLHLKSHSGELPLACPQCQKTFVDKNCFESHVSAHQGRPLHTCHMCKKSFSTAYVLKSHSCTQRDGLSHQCEWCSKPFRRKPSLDNHSMKCTKRPTQSKHTGTIQSSTTPKTV